MKGEVLFTKRKDRGFYGFIKVESGETIYFNDASMVPGTFVRSGSAVSFDVERMPGGKTKAVNVDLASPLPGAGEAGPVPRGAKGTVLFTRRNDWGFYGFIKDERGETFYFNAQSMAPGAFVKGGSAVFFDVEQMPDGKTKAVNVKQAEMQSGAEDTAPDLCGIKALLDEEKYEQILFSRQIMCSMPQRLGAEGVGYIIRAVAGFLGDDTEISLNDFERALIETERADMLIKLKDNEPVLRQGMDCAFLPVTAETFGVWFGNVCHGKKNKNTNWNGIVERFWDMKDKLSFYVTAIWLIASKQKAAFEFYIKEGAKAGDLSRIDEMLYLWKHFFGAEGFTMDLGLKRNVIGNCLDCGNIDALCRAVELFDDASMPEARQICAYLRGEAQIDSDTLFGYFHADVGERVAQKLVNLFWYRYGAGTAVPDMIVRTLSLVCRDYPENYIDVIMYDKTYADLGFSRREKAKMLVQAFSRLCDQVQTDRNTYILLNYIRTHLLEEYAYLADKTPEALEEEWQALKERTAAWVRGQFSADLRSAEHVALFKYDPAEAQEIGRCYCEQFVRPELDKYDGEALDMRLEQYRQAGVGFISQWLETYCLTSSQSADTLVRQQRFAEAIRFVQTQNSLGGAARRAALRGILCENFRIKGFDASAYEIFSHGITEADAEAILLEGLHAKEDPVIEALFAIYIHQKDWLKVAYMYSPYSSTRKKLHPELYKKVAGAMVAAHIDAAHYFDNHFEVVKTALKVLSSDEFDRFIDWAAKIPIQYGSKDYEIHSRLFDLAIKNMLTGGDYDACWRDLAQTAVWSDRNEQQDLIRYSIIASYLGRYGEARFNELVDDLTKTRGAAGNYYRYYSSVWRGLFAGKYCCNILELNAPLIGAAPLTYWNLFYETAVCGNRVFALEGLWGEQWRNKEHDVQAFYDRLLQQYSEEREPVFLKIAVKVLTQYGGVINAGFERYLLYCGGNKPKDFLFRDLICLLSQGKYHAEIGELLRSEHWSRTDTERRLSSVLEMICDDDPAGLNEQLGLELDAYQYRQFSSDLLAVFAGYPSVDIVHVLQRSEGAEQHKFQFLKTVFQIVYDQAQFRALDNAGVIAPPRLEMGEGAVRPYLEMMDLCYRRQLQTNERPNVIWVRNRYHRILAAGMLLDRSESFARYDDEDIVALMQSNGYFSDAYDNYQSFRQKLNRILADPSASVNCKKLILLAVVSNEWGQFLDHIAEFGDDALAQLYGMMALSNYRELNMQLLERYLLTRQMDVSEDEVRRVEAYSPEMGYVLQYLLDAHANDQERYVLVSRMVIGICRLKKQYDARRSYEKLDYWLSRDPDALHKHWDVCMAALWATSYKTTIYFKFADDIRNVKKRCKREKLARWEPVFQSMGQMSLYHYLTSVWYAINGQREQARQAYAKVVAKGELPAAWNQERKELEAYLQERTARFIVDTQKLAVSLSDEKQAKDLAFIAAAVGPDAVNGEEAASAYMDIEEENSAEAQLAAYRKLFRFIRNPDELYEVYRLIEMKKSDLARKTYNELVIAFGSLLIVQDAETFSHDQKFGILSSIMDVFELLSDVNKEKTSVREQINAAESFVLGKPGLSLSVWLENFERICRIISHPVVGNAPEMLDELRPPVEQCIRLVGQCETQMQILERLSAWRDNWNVPVNCSDYENAFARAVDDALYRLRHGVNLRLTVLNDADVIEDGSVFYQIENTAGKAVWLNGAQGGNCARLQVLIGVNGGTPEAYDGAGFSSAVQLRPGDVCGQSYRLHSAVVSKLRAGDVVEVILNIVVNGAVICNNAADNRRFRYEETQGVLGPGLVPAAVKYETDAPAFTRRIEGFGRKKEKELIGAYLEQQLVVIYGPSRVGKSSLLNYIAKSYIDVYRAQPEHENSAVLSVMIAGGGNDDYRISMLDGQPTAEGDSMQLFQYVFLAPLRLAFGPAGPDSRCDCFGQFPPEAGVRIGEILDSQATVATKYKQISAVLEKNGCEIWLLFDEFQQVISRLSGAAGELAVLCRLVKDELASIKLVLCGSDDLLRLFECDDDHTWDEFRIKAAGNTVPVGQLAAEDFDAMMRDRKIWGRAADVEPFSPAALKLLHQYTGGNAICGKIFGNEILARLERGDYAGRRKIYPSDVTEVAYSLFSSGEVGQVQTLLVAHNTKNLDKEMDYLLFIAGELAGDMDRAEVSYEQIRQFFASRSAGQIDLALKILLARGILKTGGDQKRYGFTTMFYFDFFSSRASDSRMQQLYEAELASQQDAAAQAETKAAAEERLMEYFKGQNSDRQAFLVSGLLSIIRDEAKENVRKIVGDFFGGDKYHQEVHVNAQTINTAFHTLLTGDCGSEAFLEAFRNMPTVDAYLSGEQRTQLAALTRELDACETEEDALDTRSRIEALTAPAEQQALGDTLGAVVISDDFTNVPDERWLELLDIPSAEELKRLRSLLGPFTGLLDFAVMLHNVFDLISSRMRQTGAANESELDYCPVAIMYCKVVEAALKQLHTPIYIRKIGRTATVKYGVYFCDLLEPDGVTIRPSRDLTIGCFAHNIVFTRDKNDVNKPESFYSAPKKSVIRRITGVENDEEGINRRWHRHAADLAVILAIRNKSAHEAAPISEANLRWLISVLFEDDELCRIAELGSEDLYK